MRKIFVFLILVTIVLYCFESCDKPKDTNPSPTSNNQSITPSFSLNFEGKTWNAVSDSITAVDLVPAININADGKGNSFSMEIGGDSVATYTVDYSTHQNTTAFTTPPNNYYIMMTGSITITAINTVSATGSFSGYFRNMNTGADSLGQGTFQVKLIK